MIIVYEIKNQKISCTNANPPTLQTIRLDSGLNTKHLLKHMLSR